MDKKKDRAFAETAVANVLRRARLTDRYADDYDFRWDLAFAQVRYFREKYGCAPIASEQDPDTPLAAILGAR